MKNNLIYLCCVVALFFSCSPAYKTSQTPDDVYYSPGKKIAVQDKYDTYASSDDHYLRMKAKDYDKWSDLDDYSYWYDSRYYANNYYSPYTSSFSLSFGYGFGSYPYNAYNPYWYNPWSSWHSPYYTVVYYKNPVVYYNPLRNNSNLKGYNNRNYNNYNMPLQNGSRSKAYTNSSMTANGNNTYYNTNQNNTNSTPVRTFNNSNSSSSSSGGGVRTSGGGTRTRP